MRLGADLGTDGLPRALRAHVAGHDVVTHGLLNGAYANGCIHGVRIETSTVPLHILTGQFRGPGYNTHCFIIESFIDECAARARDGGASFHRGTHKAWRSETGAWRASHVKVRRSLQ